MVSIVCADDYVTLSANNSATSGFAGASWSETVADPSTRDYMVNSGRTFYTSNGEVINAKSLTFGVVGGTTGNFYAYYNATFNNNGIIFAKGSCYLNKSSVNLDGKVSFTSPASAPFVFYGSKDRDRGITFPKSVSAPATAGILAYSRETNTFFVTFSADASAYLGSIVVTSRYNSAGVASGAEFRLSGTASYFGGSITVRDGATFRPQIATSVGSLSLEPGSSLSLVAGSTLTVRTALTVTGGPVPITLSGAPSAEVDAVTRYALVTMPAGSACTEADFSVPNYGSNFRTAPHLYMETSGETKTLYAAYYPTVTLETKNNGTSIGDTTTESAVTNGAYWSDGEPVHDFAHYYVKRLSGTTGIMTPYAPEETMVFPGRSLRFAEYTQIAIRTGDYTISNLYFNCGSNGTTVYGLTGGDVTLRGKFSVNANGIVSFGPRAEGVIRMAGPISGPESSLLNICGSAAGTSLCRGIVVLDGDNSAYAGKMTITIDHPGNLRFADRFLSLRVSDTASLGGARSEFAYDALKIERAGRLEAYDSFTMDEPTRGVFVSWQGRFYVASGKTMTLKEQLTVNGRVYKEGTGTLALGGALQFLDAGGALTDVAPADATNRTFFVTSGTLKPLSARSLDGLDVVFSNITSKASVALCFDASPEDADMAQYGAINLKAAVPLAAVLTGGVAIPVSFDMPAEPARQYEVPLFTVADGKAAATQALLSVPKKFTVGEKKYLVSVGTKSVTVDGASATTIFATVTERVPRGMVLSIH